MAHRAPFLTIIITAVIGAIVAAGGSLAGCRIWRGLLQQRSWRLPIGPLASFITGHFVIWALLAPRIIRIIVFAGDILSLG